MKKAIVTAAIVSMTAIGLVGCGNKGEKHEDATSATQTVKEETKTPSKFNLTKMDIRTGSGSVIGQEGITRASSLDVDEAYLNEWYKEIVKGGDCKYYVIIYIDKRNGNEVSGVYATPSGVVEKDVTLTKDDKGIYSVTSDNAKTVYTWNGSSLEK